MVKYIRHSHGFSFADFILQDPFPANDYSQVHFVSHNNLEIKGYYKLVEKTPIIDLKEQLDLIFKKFNKTTRNEINKAFLNKELIFESNSNNFDDFYSLYTDFESKKRKFLKLKSLDTLKKNSKLFLAFLNDDPIAAVLCYDTGHILRANIICSKRMASDDKEYLKIISNASRRLVYEICKYGKTHGYELFDLGEVCLNENDEKYSITKYKLSFSDKLFNSIHYYKINNPILKLLAIFFKVKHF